MFWVEHSGQGGMDTTFSLMVDGRWSERLVLSSVSDDDVLILFFILGYRLLAKKKGGIIFRQLVSI